MPPNLIFVVILAVWAAYLLQHWIRRRDHVATAKSVDRFSEAMRVLERGRSRSPMATSTAPRSYAVSPARPAQPEVVVKRAAAAMKPVAAGSGRVARAAGTTAVRAAESSVRAAGSSARIAGASAAKAVARSRGLRPATRRALLLVAGVGALIAGGLLTALTALPWWTALVGLAGFVLALALIRGSVARDRRHAASPVRPRAAGTARPGTARPGTARPGAAPQARPARRTAAGSPARRVAKGSAARAADLAAAGAPAVDRGAADLGVTAHGGSGAAVLASRSARRVTAVYDVAAEQRPVHPSADLPAGPAPELLVDADVPVSAPLAPGTWQPVPVPVPTYMLKAKATPRQRTASGAPQEAARPAAAVAVADLPFDGHAMALEEEFEELPAVHHVG